MHQLGVAAMVASLSFANTAVSNAQPSAAPQCQSSGKLVRVAELPEAAASPSAAGRQGDCGRTTIRTELVALDAKGSVTGRVRLSGAKIEDWEAVAVGACPGGSCVYIGDIGDNNAKRKRITVYRVAEPAAESSVEIKDSFHATYPDGAQDAEALLAAPDGRLFIVTKGETGAVGLYRFPKDLRPGATHQLERVGKSRASGKSAETERITDGAVSPDGTWVVLRTKQSLAFHRASDLFAGNWAEAGRFDLRASGEAQGEGVAMASDGTVYLTGEGGGKSQPGTFAKFARPCRGY